MARKPKARSPALFSAADSSLIATNRANLLAICAAGVIWPAEGYRKHYRDVSDLTPCAIPVFKGQLPGSVLRLVEREGEFFDVAIEVDSSLVKPGREVSLDDSTVVTVVGHPIPWAAVRRVYVRTSADAEDLGSRQFEDVPAEAWSAEVKPEIWSETPSALPGDVADKLAAAASAEGKSNLAGEVDRFLGAVSVMRFVTPHTLTCEIGVARLYSREFKTGKLPKMLPDVPEWIVRVSSALAPTASPVDLDQRLLESAIRVIHDSAAESGFDPVALIQAIESQARKSVNPGETGDLSRWATYATRLAKGDVSPTHLDDSGSEVKRALLLFLLRADPSRMVKAGQSTLRPGPAVHGLAGFLSGFAATYSRLDRELKGDANRHRAMSLVALNRLAFLRNAPERDAPVDFSVSSTDDEPPGVARATVKIGGLPLGDRKIEPADDMKKLYFQAKSAGFNLQFDPVWNRFVADVEIGEESRGRVFIEAGRRSRHNQPSVRFSADCPLPGSRPARALAKQELLTLLERNADLDMQCRFGISRTGGTLQVVAHQLVETLDVPELKAHLDAVARTAREVTQSFARVPVSTGSTQSEV